MTWYAPTPDDQAETEREAATVEATEAEWDRTHPRSRRWWYYPPFTCYGWRPIWHGSDEWGRPTTVIGLPPIGWLVIAHDKPHLHHDGCTAYLTVPTHGYATGGMQTLNPHPSVWLDITEDGEVAGIEVHTGTDTPHRGTDTEETQ